MKVGCKLCTKKRAGCWLHPDLPSVQGSKAKRQLKRKHCGAPKGKPGNGPRDRCKNPAGKGTNHPGYGNCHFHGGRLPSMNKAALREIAYEGLRTFGLPRVVDPHTALLEEIHRTAGHVDWLASQIQPYEPDDLVWGVTEQKDGEQIAQRSGRAVPTTDVIQKATPSIWLELYQRERRHLVDVCRVAIAAGIAERQVKIAEEQGRMIADVIRGVLRDLQIDVSQGKTAKVVRQHLMLMKAITVTEAA